MVRHSNRSQAQDILQNLQDTTERSYQELLGTLERIKKKTKKLQSELQTPADPGCSSLFSDIAKLRNNMVKGEDIAKRLKDDTAPDRRPFPEFQKLSNGSYMTLRHGTAYDHLVKSPSLFGGPNITTDDGLRVVSSLNAAFNQHHILATELTESFSNMAEALARHTRGTDEPSTQLSDQQKSELLDTLARIEQNKDRHCRQIQAARTCPLPPL